MGIGQIVSADEEGLVFKDKVRPDKNVKSSVEEVREWINKEILEFRNNKS